MNKIANWINEYEKDLNRIKKEGVIRKEMLKQYIFLTKDLLQKFREHVRVKHFESKEEEIHFFKNIKPRIRGQLKLFKTQLDYELEMPFVSNEKQIKYIQNLIKQTEIIRKKNLHFFKYMKNEEFHCDEVYFIRSKEQLLLFTQSEILDTDPCFTASHDYLATEFYYYNQIKTYFKQELHCLKSYIT